MTWARRRQFLYVSILLIFFLIVGFFVSYPYLHVAPSCFDFKQDGDETGIDCGGSCSRSCTADVNPVTMLWARTFKVVDGRYNAVAYLQNKNTNDAIDKIKYTFTFADKNNTLISTRTGETYVPVSGRFAVFEPAIDVGTSVPVYTTFQFSEDPDWEKVSQKKIDQLKLSVDNIDLEDETTSPHMSATIRNQSLFSIPDLDVVTILYNPQGDAVSASRTYVSVLEGGQSADVNFTWPEPFTEPIVAKEVLPMYNIFDVNF